MSFIWPAMLGLLLVVPLLGWLYLRIQQRRRLLAMQYGQSGFISGTTRPASNKPRYFTLILFLTGVTVLLLSSARPEAIVNLPRIAGTVILAFDASGSMVADDVKPSRMEAAKEAARAFIEHQPSSVQVGVVSFSDSGFTIQAPTNDQKALLAAIDRLTPEHGTSLAQGIIASLSTIAATVGNDHLGADPGNGGTEAVSAAPDSSTDSSDPASLPQGSYPSAIIVLLTDGENNAPPDPIAAAQAASDRQVRIYTIGIGSPAGALLEIDGFIVHTRLNEPTLRLIAEQTGAQYFNVSNATELQDIYSSITPQLMVKPEKMEITSIFAGAGMLLLLIGGVFSMIWYNRAP